MNDLALKHRRAAVRIWYPLVRRSSALSCALRHSDLRRFLGCGACGVLRRVSRSPVAAEGSGLLVGPREHDGDHDHRAAQEDALAGERRAFLDVLEGEHVRTSEPGMGGGEGVKTSEGVAAQRSSALSLIPKLGRKFSPEGSPAGASSSPSCSCHEHKQECSGSRACGAVFGSLPISPGSTSALLSKHTGRSALSRACSPRLLRPSKRVSRTAAAPSSFLSRRTR